MGIRKVGCENQYSYGGIIPAYAALETMMGWYGSEESIKEIKYTDSRYTDDIGLIYLRARYYNLQIGQFIQIDENRGDIENIESQNHYAFAKQNSNKYIDKDGKSAMIMMSDGGRRSGGIVSAISRIAGSVKKATQKVGEKRKKDPRNMTSQDCYSLWVGNNSWSNWKGGKHQIKGMENLSHSHAPQKLKELLEK